MTGQVGDADHDDLTVDASDISPSSDELTLHRSDSASASPTDDAVVFSVSSFDFFRFHARGGVGEVYKAGDIDLGRDVALKFIRREQEANSDSRSQFIVEGEVTARLEHPGVVPVYGLGYTTDGRPFHVMRFIQGDTLGEQIEAYHQSCDAEESASELRVEFRGLLTKFVSVCNTIAYAHNRGIVHRDIKPENIMLGKYGEALIIDWGLARPVERDERARASGEMTLRPGSSDTETDFKDGVVPRKITGQLHVAHLGSV